MRSILIACAAGLMLGPVVAGTEPARAVDHGQMGQTWPVIEPDLMSVIKAKLDEAQRTGKIDDLNREFARKAEQRVMRPVPVAGIRAAEQDRSWEYDPAIVVENDIRDHKGNLIAAAGQRVNPFDTVRLTKNLIFINGDSQAELDWAMAHGTDREAKIIMVNGSPFERMKAYKRRFYFDQSGVLTERFGIRHTPALVEQEGQVLVVSEKAIPRGKSS